MNITREAAEPRGLHGPVHRGGRRSGRNRPRDPDHRIRAGSASSSRRQRRGATSGRWTSSKSDSPSPLPISTIRGPFRRGQDRRRTPRRGCGATGTNQFTAFAVYCTHLGCPVLWIQKPQIFLCPCHGSVFNGNGDVAGGPAPQPLFRYPVRIRSGRVEIQAVEQPLTT